MTRSAVRGFRRKKRSPFPLIFGIIPTGNNNQPKRSYAVNDTIIAAKAKEQHDNFLGRVFAHFSKPKARFVRESTYGIQASGDTRLSSIVRAIEDDVAPIQTEKRLFRGDRRQGRRRL